MGAKLHILSSLAPPWRKKSIAILLGVRLLFLERHALLCINI